LRIVAGKDGPLRIRDNFGGRTPEWSLSGIRKVGDNFEVALHKGEAVEATLPRPPTLPPAPADAAKPVVERPARQPNRLKPGITDSLWGVSP
jgi:hypothetical protein